MWGYCPASVTISLGSQPFFAWKRLLLVLSLHWAPAGLAVTGLVWADEYGTGLLPEITTSSRFMALLRLYFLRDRLNVAYEICAAMDLVFTKGLGGGCFIEGFMPWVNEALTINLGSSPQSVGHLKRKSHPKSIWVGEHAQFQHYSLELVQLTVTNFQRDDEYMFSCKLSGYYIIRANSKENTNCTFLPEKYFQSLLPPVKMLTNALFLWSSHQVFWHTLTHEIFTSDIIYKR